jgi:hypothetical protein
MAKKPKITQVKDYEDYKESNPSQLELFRNAAEVLGPQYKKYSNTVELYDILP